MTDDDFPAEEEQDKVGVLVDHSVVEPAFQSTVAYSMVVEADRMSDYQAQVTDDDFPSAEEQDESVAFAIEEEEDIALPLLPEGWIECVDPTTSKVYYYNSTTEISRWERPSTHQEGGEEIKDTHEGDRQPVEIMDVNEQATTDVAVLNEALPAAGVGYEIEIAAANAVLPADEVAKVNKVPFAIKEENLSGDAVQMLPEGWIECVEPTTNKVYYYNSTTEVSSWDRPITCPEKGEENLGNQVSNEAPATAGVADTIQSATAKSVQPPEEVSEVNEVPAAINLEEKGQTIPTDSNLTTLAVKTEDGLPEGWIESHDETTGMLYFYNEASGVSQWDRPTVERSPSVTSDIMYKEAIVEDALNNENAAVAPPVMEPDQHVDSPCSTDEPPVQHFVSSVAIDAVPMSTTIEPREDYDEVSTQPSETSDVHTESSADTGVSSANLSFESLPPDWIEAIDPSSGIIYYYNESSGETAWDRPFMDDRMDAATDGMVKEGEVDAIEEEEEGAEEDVRTDDKPHGESLLDRVTQPVVVAGHEDGTKGEEATLPSVIKQQGQQEAHPKLPPGWIEAIDSSSGKNYYYNETSGETTWDCPFMDDRMDAVTDGKVMEGEVDTKEEEEGAEKDVLTNDEPTGMSTWEKPELEKRLADTATVVASSNNAIANEKEIKDDFFVANSTGHTKLANPVDSEGGIAVVDIPESTSASQQQEPQDEKHKEEEWIETTDLASGNMYYYNPITGETSWTKPGPRQIDVDARNEAELSGVNDVASNVDVTAADIIEGADELKVTKCPSSAETLDEGWTQVDHPSPASNQGGDDPLLSSGDGNDSVLPKGWIDANDPITVLQQQEHEDENCTESEWAEVTDPASGNKYFFNPSTGETSWTKPEKRQIEEPEIAKVDDDNLSAEEDYAVDEPDIHATPVESEVASVGTNSDSVGIPEPTNRFPTDEGVIAVVDVPESASMSQQQELREGESHKEEEWIEATDPTSGNIYYYKPANGETSWTKPEPCSTDVNARKEAEILVTSEVSNEDDVLSKKRFEKDKPEMQHVSAEVHGIKGVDDGPDVTKEVNNPLLDTSPSALVDSYRSLPEGWAEVNDQTSGLVYYYNEISGETTWDRPAHKEVSAKQEPIISSKVDATLAKPRTNSSASANQRPRPAHAIATFGFGGRLCVMIPRPAASLSGAVPRRRDRPATMRRGPVVIHRLCNLIPRSHEYSIPSSATPSAPLINRQEGQVLSYLENMSSSPENLLWNVIYIAAQNRGSKLLRVG